MITNSEGISQYVSQKMPVVAQHTEKFYKYNRHIEQHNDRYNIALAHKKHSTLQHCTIASHKRHFNITEDWYKLIITCYSQLEGTLKICTNTSHITNSYGYPRALT